MTQRSFTTTYFRTVASAIILHFKWQNQTVSKLVSELIHQLCVLIVINMHHIKEALHLSWTQSQKRGREKRFFDIMPLLKHCQGSSLFNYRKILWDLQKDAVFLFGWNDSHSPPGHRPELSWCLPLGVKLRQGHLHFTGKTASPGFGLIALFSLHAEAPASVGSSCNTEFELRWTNSLDRV